MTNTTADLPSTDLVGAWTVDPAHSRLGFSVRHMMVSKVRGQFSEYDANVTIADDPSQSRVDATVQIASIDTHDANRDGHLRSGEFFDAETHPTMTFTTTGLTGSGSDYQLAGELTIRGVTKPVVFDLEYQGVGKNPWGATVAGLTATTKISREEFGLTWNQALETGGVLIGDKIDIELDLELTKATAETVEDA
ncbi:MAG: YceI family protein [Ilumatobacteraceae bacterium]